MIKEEIIKRANNFLEETKNLQQEFQEERNLIFELLNDIKDSNLEMLNKVVKICEKSVYINKENKSYKEFKLLKKKVERQKIRRTDETIVEKLVIFCVKDKKGEQHKFLTRENLEKYIETNKENFSNDIEIELGVNEYLDLEQLLKDSK